MHTLKPLTYEQIIDNHQLFTVMPVHALEAERQQLLSALPPALSHSQITADQRELEGFAIDFLHKLRGKPVYTSAELSDALHNLSDYKTQQIRLRLGQLQLSFAQVVRVHGRDFQATSVLLVHPNWVQRWSELLFGDLHPVWVQRLSVADYSDGL